MPLQSADIWNINVGLSSLLVSHVRVLVGGLPGMSLVIGLSSTPVIHFEMLSVKMNMKHWYSAECECEVPDTLMSAVPNICNIGCQQGIDGPLLIDNRCCAFCAFHKDEGLSAAFVYTYVVS